MRWLIGAGLMLVLVLVGVTIYQRAPQKILNILPNPNEYTVELTEYSPPPVEPDEEFQDDNPADKKPVFDPDLVDSRTLGAWRVNLSDALIRLDVPIVKPDVEGPLLELHRSYADAIRAHTSRNPHGAKILPSINMIDGKAKQFDDGLYAALDLAYYEGIDKVLVGHSALVRRFFDKVGPESPAAPFLAAGLDLAGIKVDVKDPAAKERLKAKFLANAVASKPIGFYAWNDKLGELFRFLRFFQGELPAEVSKPLIQAIRDDKSLRSDYEKLIGFFSKLTNPRAKPSLLQPADDPSFAKPVSFLPPAVTKEGRLFETLFPLGLPPNANLMRELVKAIKSGEVSLEPKPESGWYDLQVHALETMLLPEKGDEANKLVLTKNYKKRMLEAFQALVTKRKETHVRDSMLPKSAAAPPPSKMSPRLRLEPASTYYLRTARAYGFLAHFLESALGEKPLASLHGLKQGGTRAKDLKTELAEMRELFLGCYLLSCEDIGMKPAFHKDEPVDVAKCVKAAEKWLETAKDDPDLAVDTRVIVPVYADLNSVKCWSTVGVRLAKLDASFAAPPSIKEAEDGKEWIKAESYTLETSRHLIPVDEFAEVELGGNRVLTREEFRAVCDAERTREKIVRALGR